MDAGADQIVLAGRAGHPVRRAGRDERGARMVVVAGRGLDVDLLAVARDRPHGDGLEHLHAVALRLQHDPVGELGPADAFGEAWVVVEPFRDAGLTTQALAVDHQRLQVLSSGVDRRGEPRRPTADDDQVVDVHHRDALEADLLGELLVGRFGQMGAVGEDDRRDDVVPVVAFLHRPNTVGVDLDVVPLERDPLVTEEPLRPTAVGAPARAVDPDQVVHPASPFERSMGASPRPRPSVTHPPDGGRGRLRGGEGRG